MTNLADIPPEILEQIFDQFESPKDVISISETCKKFKELIEQSEKLTRKLTLYVYYPAYLSSFKSMLKKSKRSYRNICLIRSRSRSCDGQYRSLKHAFEIIGPSIKSLSLNWCQLRNLDTSGWTEMDVVGARHRMMYPFNQNILREGLYKEFISIIKHFTNLEKTVWNNVNIERKVNQTDLLMFNFSSLKTLEMQHCDAYCFDVLSSAKKLLSIKISGPLWSNNRNPGIDDFETFLMSQKALKSLHLNSIQYPRLFRIDQSFSIEFKLNHLVLKNVFFENKNYAENFFKTQDQLKTISFQLQNEKVRNLDELNWYNNIIRIVLSQNCMLSTIIFEKIKYKIINCDFLDNTKNLYVRELRFNAFAEDRNAELFKAMLRIFPNLKIITYKSEESEDNDGDVCFDKGTILDNAKQLSIINASVESLINVCAENLQQFEFTPKSNGKFIDDYIGGFLHRHRNIRDLKIGCKSGRSYFFVSYKLCELIVNFIQQLESITIYNFGEVNKSVKLLCTLRNLRSLTLSSVQYQQFTAKTKVECDRMKLKLIPVKINCLYEAPEYSESYFNQ